MSSLSPILPDTILMQIFTLAILRGDGPALSLVDSRSKKIVFLIMQQNALKIRSASEKQKSLLDDFICANVDPKRLDSYSDCCLVFRRIIQRAQSLTDSYPSRILFPDEIPAMRAAVPNAQDRALEKFWNFIKSTTNRRLPHLRNAAEIRAWVEQTQEFFSKNEYLNCDKIKLDLLPVEIGLFTSLKTLILSFNWLGTLPSEIGQLKNLESLDVSFNALKTLPSEIGHCKKLTNLNFSNNLITFLPPEIGQLTDLKVLRAFNNRIKKFPPEICSCGFPGSTSLLSIYLLCSKNNVDPKTLKNLFSEFVKNQKKSRPEAFLHIIADNFENQFYAQVWAQSDKPQTLDQLQWGKEHAFDNISNFQKAIVETVSHQIRNFLFKNKVFDVIYQLAGSPNTNESNWGEKHAFENPERLIQAYELVRNHVVILNVS